MSIIALLPTESLCKVITIYDFFSSEDFFELYCSLHELPNTHCCIYHKTRLIIFPENPIGTLLVDNTQIILFQCFSKRFKWQYTGYLIWLRKVSFFSIECTTLSQDKLPWKKYTLLKVSWETKSIKEMGISASLMITTNYTWKECSMDGWWIYIVENLSARRVTPTIAPHKALNFCYQQWMNRGLKKESLDL